MNNPQPKDVCKFPWDLRGRRARIFYESFTQEILNLKDALRYNLDFETASGRISHDALNDFLQFVGINRLELNFALMC